MTTDEQVLRAADGDYSTSEWSIGGVCRLEPRDGDWALVTQWGTSYLLQRRGLVQLIQAAEAALDSDLGLTPETDSIGLWEALNTEIQTRQGCAKSLNERLDRLEERFEALESVSGASLAS